MNTLNAWQTFPCFGTNVISDIIPEKKQKKKNMNNNGTRKIQNVLHFPVILYVRLIFMGTGSSPSFSGMNWEGKLLLLSRKRDTP